MDPADLAEFLHGIDQLAAGWPALLDRTAIDDLAHALRREMPLTYLAVGWLTPDGAAMRSYAIWSQDASMFPYGRRIPVGRERLRTLYGGDRPRYAVYDDTRSHPTYGDEMWAAGIRSLLSLALCEPTCGLLVVGFPEVGMARAAYAPRIAPIADEIATRFRHALQLARAQQLDAFIRAATDGVFILSRELDVNFANRAAVAMWRAERGGLVGQRADRLLDAGAPIEECAGGGDLPALAVVGDERFPIEINVVRGEDPAAAYQIHIRDMRQVRRVEEDLRRSNRQLRDLREVARAGGVAIDFSDAARRALVPLRGDAGERHVLIARWSDGRLSAQAQHGERIAVAAERIAAELPTIDPATDVRSLRLDGLELFVAPLVVDGAIAGVMASSAADCDEQCAHLRACADALAGSLASTLRYEAMHAAARRQEQTLDNIPAIIYGVDLDGRIRYVNAAIERVLGYTPSEVVADPSVLAASAVDPTPRDLFRSAVAENLRSGRPVPWVDLRSRRRDGRIITLRCAYFAIRDDDGRPSSYLGVAQDVTVELETGRQLVAADRLAALGMLAAGVGHEINNPAAYIILGVEQMQRYLAQARTADDARPLLDRMRATLDDIQEGIHRIATITAELRLLARHPDAPAAGQTDINRLLQSVAAIVEPELRSRARLELELSDVPPLPGNYGRLSQVLLNLLVNALQATPRGAPERHRVRVSSGVDGGDVVVTVRDSGDGIAPEVLPHIFDPFFTTKAPGEGTGLGLAISYDLVHQLGGHLTAESKLGQGTALTLRVPLVPLVPRPDGEAPGGRSGPGLAWT